jgi:hypothetical protein
MKHDRPEVPASGRSRVRRPLVPRHLSPWHLTPLVVVPCAYGAYRLLYDLTVGTVFRLLVGDIDERERQIAEAMAEFLFDEPEVPA